MITVQKILESWLTAHGFDGLYCDDCGCDLADLGPCCDNFSKCMPGYKVSDGDGDWIIQPDKPKETP